jgi:outer membrane receptor for ferrienterochelin and colicins
MGKKYRGGTDVYGESIYNVGSYWVLMNSYCRKMLFSFSYTDHDQNSIYGDMPYLAKQHWLWAIDLG